MGFVYFSVEAGSDLTRQAGLTTVVWCFGGQLELAQLKLDRWRWRMSLMVVQVEDVELDPLMSLGEQFLDH